MTVEQIDKHVDRELKKFNSSRSKPKAVNICAVYKIVAPILKFVTAFLFWKPKWVAAIKQFTEIADAQCKV